MNIPTPFGPVHICADEVCAFVSTLPFVSVAWYSLKAKFSKRHANCTHGQVESQSREAPSGCESRD